jgi:hypothetical protein
MSYSPKVPLALWLTALAVLVWLAMPRGPSNFERRWAPAFEHPLHSVSAARASFCYPVKCLNS